MLIDHNLTTLTTLTCHKYFEIFEILVIDIDVPCFHFQMANEIKVKYLMLRI